MFYRVSQRARSYYKLRLNRTTLARTELKRNFAINLLVTTGVYIFILGTVGVLIANAVIFDWGYTRSYPGCSYQVNNSNIYKLEPFGKSLGESGWSITFTSHRLLAFLADFLENSVVWLDSCFALTYVHSFLILLNEDLLLYWRYLHAKIEHTLLRVKTNFQIRDQMNMFSGFEFEQQETNVSNQDKPVNTTFPVLFEPTRPERLLSRRGGNKHEYAASECKSTSSNLPTSAMSTTQPFPSYHQPDHIQTVVSFGIKTPQELEQAVFELQVEIIDFFRQMRAADSIVSDHLTSLLTIWFLTFSLLSYHSIMRAHSHIPVVVHLIQAFDFLTITITSLNLFRLHSSCLKSYKVICSLMAYDSSKYKRRFAKILDYYTNQRRFNYTLFWQYPYTPTMYLSIIGWTFSCFFIIESLFKYVHSRA